MNEYHERYLQQLTSQYPVLDREYERQLLLRVDLHGDPVARELLFKHNVKLIISCVQKFCHINDPRFQDLFQAGSMSIFTAIDRFDTTRMRDDGAPIKFSTFAVWWIMAGIRAELQRLQAKTPPSFQKLRVDFKKAAQELRKQLRYTPNDEEVYDYLEWDEVNRALYELSYDRQVVSLSNLEPTGSADAVGSDDLVDRTDTEALAIEAIQQEDLAAAIEAALEDLEPIESDIVRRRNGLGGTKPQSCEEIAQLYLMTREQVRDIHAGALAQLWVLLEDLKKQVE